MVNTKIIQLIWEGPFQLHQLEILQNDSINYGVYQIYGKHPIYGNDVLLYIGKADKQTFGKRISQENWGNVNDSNCTEIYVGRLAGKKIPSEEAWSKEITQAESLLIYIHKPAYNAKNIGSIDYEDLSNIHILNWGNYRSLHPEVSGLRWATIPDCDVYRWE